MRDFRLATLLLTTAVVLPAAEADNPRPGGSRLPHQSPALLTVPAHDLDVVLGRPTATGIIVSIHADPGRSVAIAYGIAGPRTDAGDPPTTVTPAVPVPAEGVVSIPLTGLRANTAYAYQVRSPGITVPRSGFHTARAPGQGFSFTITADSHLDENTDPALYARTLATALEGRPDFHIDLGDTFMTEKHATRDDAARQYLAQRFYLGSLCRSAPLFLVLGNHDGEYPRGKDGADAALWALGMRTRWFPNPIPDGFYSGNAESRPDIGPMQDYYSWAWGDVRCIVLDPFWYSQRRQEGNWKRSLGEAQYRWLAATLAASRERYRFVFTHHLVGGADPQSRGGAEASALYEWGGHDPDGSDTFAVHRPGWPAPIHALLVQHRVAAVFHGHDHFYARQERDGVVYQEVPQPGHPGSEAVPRSAADYGYRSGFMLGCSGHLRVTVAADRATVALIRSDGSIAHEYPIVPQAQDGKP